MRVQRLLAQGKTNAVADAQQQQAWADYLQCIGEGTKQVFLEVGEEVVLILEDMSARVTPLIALWMKFTATLATS
jgi:hypothetical protein